MLLLLGCIYLREPLLIPDNIILQQRFIIGTSFIALPDTIDIENTATYTYNRASLKLACDASHVSEQ